MKNTVSTTLGAVALVLAGLSANTAAAAPAGPAIYSIDQLRACPAAALASHTDCSKWELALADPRQDALHTGSIVRPHVEVPYTGHGDPDDLTRPVYD